MPPMRFPAVHGNAKGFKVLRPATRNADSHRSLLKTHWIHSRHPSERLLQDPWQTFLDVVVAVAIIAEGIRLFRSDHTSLIAVVAVLLVGLAASIARVRAPSLALTVSAVVAVLLPLVTGQHITGWSLLEINLASYASH